MTDPWAQVRDAIRQDEVDRYFNVPNRMRRPYLIRERRRVSRSTRLRDAVLLALALTALLAIMSIDRVDAYPPPPGPPQVCQACPTPRPTPVVVGFPAATESPAPVPTIPPTDTED